MTFGHVDDIDAEVEGPRALEAEHAVLGLIWFDNGLLASLPEPLPPSAFTEPLYEALWSATLELIKDGRLAEPTVLMTRFRDAPAFKALGGLRHLADLVDKAPPGNMLGEYARRLLEASRRREIIRICGAATTSARDGYTDPFSILNTATTALTHALTDAAPDGASMIDARTSLGHTVAQLIEDRATGKPRGAMTGLRCFDRRMGGLKPGKLIIIAGRPSMGKSGLCRGGAVGCARKNPDKSVIYFTLEMDRDEIGLRNLSQFAYENGRPFKYQDIEDDYEHIGPAVVQGFMDLVDRAPDNLIMDDTPALSFEYVRRRTLAQVRKRPVAAIFIDYLQIMQRPPSVNGRNDAALIGEMTSALKQLAREAGCAVVLLSQLSRNVEQRENKRPMLSDLRESGAIEQDANAVLFCFREHYYLTREGPTRGVSDAEHAIRLAEVETKMEVICAKQRAGPVGTDVQRYLAPYDVIEDEGIWP